MNNISLILFIFIGQIVCLALYLDINRIFLALCSTVFGAFVGFLCYIVYTELTLSQENKEKIDISGKCTLITGCDSGFGLMLAKSLAERGMFVFACVLSINSCGAEDLKNLKSVKVIKMNVTNGDDVDEGFSVVENHLKENNSILWAVVNNAGIGCCRMIQFTPIDKIRQLLEVNTLGMLRVCQKFSSLLLGHGRIINITSIAGSHVSPFLGAYCCSKFASEAISKAMRIEMYSLGIAVITIQPDAYKTAILFSSDHLYGTDEVSLYGKSFMEKCQERIMHWVLNANENLHEIIETLENAILNKTFQYTYNPNFCFRLKILLLKCFSERYLISTGHRDTALSIPVKAD